MATDPRRPFVPAPFWLALWLAPVLVAAKVAHWGWPWEAVSGPRVWLRDVFVSSHADVAFAAGFGLVAFVLLAAARVRPALERTVGFALFGLGTFAALYAVAAVQIFDFLRSPLTYPLLYLAGDMDSMSSSINTFVTPGVVTAMVVATLGYAGGVVWSSLRDAHVPGLARLVAPVVLLAGAVVWGCTGAELAAGRWSDRSDLLIARNPHWEFLASVTHELAGGADVPDIGAEFPVEFLADFTPKPQAPRVAFASARGSKKPRPRNIVKVVLESTGTRYLSVYGSPYPTTPALEAAAKNAVVYDAFYSHAGFTANALASMSLSVHPYMTWREYTQEYPDFPGVTVAEVLKPLGYRTAFFTTSFLEYVCMGCFLEGRGYDDIRDWKVIGGGEELNSWGGYEKPLVDSALEWIAASSGDPFYLTIWTQQTHHPYESAPGAPVVDFFQFGPRPENDYDLGRYLNAVAQADREIGRLFEGLKARGLDDDTIVIVTGDHGEAFGEPHGTWGHGFRLYDEGTRVPMMVWSPTLFPEGRRDATVGGHVDLNATILDLLGLEPVETWEGRSLFAPDRPPRTYFYAANDDYLLGVRERDHKYILNVTRGREELYDLARDPDERTNIASSHPELCHTLRQRLAAWKAHASASLARARTEMEKARGAATRQASLD